MENDRARDVDVKGFGRNMKDPEPVKVSDDDGGTDLRKGAWLVWTLSCLLALGVSHSIVSAVFRIVTPLEFLTGWGLASINAVCALVINITAMQKKKEGFVAWGAVGNVLRALGVLAIVLVVKLQGSLKFEPFITAFMVSYFVFMIAETLRLNFLNLRSKR